MKIKDIKIPEVKEKALEYAEKNDLNEETLLCNAFTWVGTDEGRPFWEYINDKNPDVIKEVDDKLFILATEIKDKHTIETLHQSLKIINVEIHPNTLAKVVKMYDIIKVKGGAITLQEILKLK